MSGAGYGKSCDIWSAGVVLYILLCGFLPFDAAEPGSREKLALPAFAADVDFPKPYWDHMSDASKDLVRRMLVMDPKARITTAKVLQHNWIEMCRQGTLPQVCVCVCVCVYAFSKVVSIVSCRVLTLENFFLSATHASNAAAP